MRRGSIRARGIVIVVAVAAPLAAQAHEPTPCYAWTESASPQTFYPPAALAAKVDGAATLSCARNERDGMTDCQVVSERPAGRGFGAAALAMAAKSKEASAAAIAPSQRRPRKVFFEFRADAPCITPNVIDLPWLPVPAVYRHYPDTFQIARASSDARVDRARDGEAALSCKVAADGHLTDCRIVGEKPKGGGFGEAGLMLTQYMVVSPITRDGVSIVGERLTVGVPFNGLHLVGMQ